jgi:hypothetical protein
MSQLLIRQPNEQAWLDRKGSIQTREFTQYTISANFVMAKNPYTKDYELPACDHPWTIFEAFRQANEIKKIGIWPAGLDICHKDEVILIAYPKEFKIKYPRPASHTFITLGALYIGRMSLPSNTISNEN